MCCMFSVNLGQVVFESISRLVSYINSVLLPNVSDEQHYRNPLLTSYIQYSCVLPHTDNSQTCKYVVKGFDLIITYI